MEAAAALERLGGIAARHELTRLTTPSSVQRAVLSGQIVRLPRHHFALPGVDRARATAAAAGGVVSHLSAAQHWQWKLKRAPGVPEVTVPRGRRLDRGQAPLAPAAVRVHWGEPDECDLRDGVTSPARTVVDCARALDFDEALAVADSALRSGLVTREQLRNAAGRSPRTGRARALRVAREATALSANPFESVLRAIGLGVPGLALRPQVWVGNVGRADLVDERLGIVVEADSWEYHATPEAFRVDVRRYAAFARLGRVVVRFDWDRVMGNQPEVHTTLADVARVRERQLFGSYCSSCGERAG